MQIDTVEETTITKPWAVPQGTSPRPVSIHGISVEMLAPMPLLPRSARRALDPTHQIKMEGKGNQAKPLISAAVISHGQWQAVRRLAFAAAFCQLFHWRCCIVRATQAEDAALGKYPKPLSL